MLVAVSVALTALPQQAFACTCAPPESPTDELERSTAVFAGKVTALEAPTGKITSSADPVEVTFRVYTVWKGPSSDTLTITTARSSISCGYEFEIGHEYLVYARDKKDDLKVSLCSRTKSLARAGGDLAALRKGNGTAVGAELQVYKYLVILVIVIGIGAGVGIRSLFARRADN